jgi:hypothetical protein
MSDVSMAVEPVRSPLAPVVTKRTAPLFKLKPTRLHQGESKIRTWYAVIEEGTPYDEIFNPIYWDNHAAKFAIGDWIRITDDESTYDAELKVVSTGVGGVRVSEYFKKVWAKGSPKPEVLSSQYEVKWGGPQHKWRIVRVSDNHVESHSYESEADANKWLTANLNNLLIGARKAV